MPHFTLEGGMGFGRGVLIVGEAGGVVSDHRGERMVYNRAVPRFPKLVAAPPGLHAHLIEHKPHRPVAPRPAKQCNRPGRDSDDR
jgi:hypothetical protein